MRGSLLLLLILTACTQSLYASDSCHEEAARLREREKLLKSQLQKQELLLHRLQLLNQPRNYKVRADQSQDTQYADCSQLFSAGHKSSGLYRIKANGSPSRVQVYCDMSEGGGWTVIQRRLSGAQTFNRSWEEYKNGFGDMDAEFWLGNDNLHYITEQGNYTLRINLEDFDGNQRYAEYKNFRVADEKHFRVLPGGSPDIPRPDEMGFPSVRWLKNLQRVVHRMPEPPQLAPFNTKEQYFPPDHYRLSFGVYVGTAGDAFSGTYQVGVSDWASHQGIKFSTYDQDNDNYNGNCAEEDKGGWWFNKCHSAHLNGKYYSSGYYNSVTDDGVVWYTWRGWWYSLKTSIMKLRPTAYEIDPIDDPNVVHRSPHSQVEEDLKSIVGRN